MKQLSLVFVTIAAVLVGCSTSVPRPSNVPTGAVDLAEARQFPGFVKMDRGIIGSRDVEGYGTIQVAANLLSWHDTRKSAHDFSLRPEVISKVWLSCASRPGESLCLELGIETLTDNRYFFRDESWESGGNASVTELFEYLKTVYPQVHYDRRTSDDIH